MMVVTCSGIPPAASAATAGRSAPSVTASCGCESLMCTGECSGAGCQMAVRRMQGKLKNVEDDEVFFDDVAGIDMAKQELSEIVDFFNFPERYAKSGARSPRGCLLYGPPGKPLLIILLFGTHVVWAWPWTKHTRLSTMNGWIACAWIPPAMVGRS